MSSRGLEPGFLTLAHHSPQNLLVENSTEDNRKCCENQSGLEKSPDITVNDFQGFKRRVNASEYAASPPSSGS